MSSHYNHRLNKYRIMWVIVMFDLPTTTKQELKEYTTFRKGLLGDGFRMFQESIYIRHCPSKENADVHVRRIKNMLPPKGTITVMMITDKQFGDSLTFMGTQGSGMPEGHSQLLLF
jgi:CRISPR-associated protein Cas2